MLGGNMHIKITDPEVFNEVKAVRDQYKDFIKRVGKAVRDFNPLLEGAMFETDYAMPNILEKRVIGAAISPDKYELIKSDYKKITRKPRNGFIVVMPRKTNKVLYKSWIEAIGIDRCNLNGLRDILFKDCSISRNCISDIIWNTVEPNCCMFRLSFFGRNKEEAVHNLKDCCIQIKESEYLALRGL